MIEKHGNLLLKSGTDFRNLTHVKVTFPDVPGQRVGLTWKEIPILLSTPEDKEMRKVGGRPLHVSLVSLIRRALMRTCPFQRCYFRLSS